MGNAVSEARKARTRKAETRILLVGLDAAGKTTILYKLKLGEVVTTIPTIGFNLETVRRAGGGRITSFTAFDVGGRDKIRPLWRHYYQGTDAVVFVVDSNDRERLEDAKVELDKMLDEELLKDCPLLVFANKQDLPGRLSVEDVARGLGLDSLCGPRKWHVQGSCATTLEGLWKGMDWLTSAVQAQREGGAAEAQRDREADRLVADLRHAGDWLTIAEQSARLAGPAANSGTPQAAAPGDHDPGADTDSTADTEALQDRLETAAAAPQAA